MTKKVIIKNPKKNKAKLLECLKDSLGIVQTACMKAGLSRDTFYHYCRTDPVFKEQVDDIYEIALDYVETRLLTKIKEGSEKSIHFYLRNKGRNRGYGDTLDVTSNGDNITEIKLIPIKSKNDLDDSKH